MTRSGSTQRPAKIGRQQRPLVVIDLCMEASCPAAIDADLWVACVVPQWRLDLVRIVVASLQAAGNGGRVDVLCPGPDNVLRAWIASQPHQGGVWLRVLVKALPAPADVPGPNAG